MLGGFVGTVLSVLGTGWCDGSHSDTGGGALQEQASCG